MEHKAKEGIYTIFSILHNEQLNSSDSPTTAFTSLCQLALAILIHLKSCKDDIPAYYCLVLIITKDTNLGVL